MKVKICGLMRQEDAELAIEVGADALGFVFEPTSPRFLPSLSRAFILEMNPYAHCIAVFGRRWDASGFAGCNSIQCSDPEIGLAPWLLPPLIQVLRPRSPDIQVATAEFAAWLDRHDHCFVRGVLLDAFDENAFGGTGKRVDWNFAADFVRISPKPVILAGGLTPDNVAEAIRKVHPYAVDVSSGVEISPGIKDPVKMRDFIQAAKGA